MTNSYKSQSHKAGLPPGSLVHIGNRKSDKAKITVIDYNPTDHSSIELDNIEDCLPYKDHPTVTWINIDGLHDTAAIGKLGEYFGLHTLLLEDVLNTSHRPKVELFDDHLFITLKILGIDHKTRTITSEQVSLVLGDSWVISFQEQQGDVFNVLRTRIQDGKGIIRQKGVDYLVYRLIDTVVDNYFFVTEHLSENVEQLEERVLRNPDNQALQEIQRMKKQIIEFRRVINPLRDAVSSLQMDTGNLIKKTTIRYLHDVYEHIIQVLDTIEIQRESISSIMELYLSGISQKGNQVMQVLTIIATIFIPLTFIAGIYGMNFDYMPELRWKYGYFGIWGTMIFVIVAMLTYFKRKGWLKNSQ